jgi:tetratricopeptide (TPR) repeat protein
MKFKDYLEEAVISKLSKDELITSREILDEIKKEKLFKTKVLYRGFSAINQYFAEIENKRSSFYGSMRADTSRFIKDELKVKYPTFCTTDETQASMFGKVFIFLPTKAEYFQSDYIRDVLSDLTLDTEEDFEDAKSLYKKSKKIPRSMGEIIVSTEKYFLIDYIGLSKSFSSKFYTPKTDISKLTYQDIYDLISAYLSLSEYKIKKGYRDDFETTIKKSKESHNRLIQLRKERTSATQLSTRTKMLQDYFDAEDIEYELEGFEFVFRTQKLAKEAFKPLKKVIENRQNNMKMMDLSKIEYYNAELKKNKIITL